MQFFGFKKNILFSALDANKKEIYTCPECGGALKRRSGPFKSPHFYHLRRPRECRQHGKTQEHLKTQLFIERLLPQETVRMEHPFPEIGRIADVAWLSEKIVFEVQCSPISLEEVKKRNEDYGSLGFYVIWILHDKRFNKRRLGAAEEYLRSLLSYFSNISRQGKGFIYDQKEDLEGFIRKRKDAPLPICIHQPIFLSNPLSLPQILEKRMQAFPFYFPGDLMDRFLEFQENPSFEKKSEFTNHLMVGLKRLYRRLLLGVLRPLTHDDLSNPLSK